METQRQSFKGIFPTGQKYIHHVCTSAPGATPAVSLQTVLYISSFIIFFHMFFFFIVSLPHPGLTSLCEQTLQNPKIVVVLKLLPLYSSILMLQMISSYSH